MGDTMPEMEIVDNLICIGGPLDGQFVNVYRKWRVFQSYGNSGEGDLQATITTYLRGEIVFPGHVSGESYKYLYAEGMDQYLCGIQAAHTLGHGNKL